MIHIWRYLYVILEEQDKEIILKWGLGVGRQKQQSAKVPRTRRKKFPAAI